MPSRTLDEILTEINVDIMANTELPSSDYYTEAWMQPRNEINWPIIRTGRREGQKISPKDTRGMQFYHRQVEPQENAPLEQYKGINSYQQTLYHMRFVGIGARATITMTDYNDNADICNGIMEILASNSSLTQREQLIVESANTNVLEVLNSEYAGNESTNQKWSLDTIAFSIDYTIKQKTLGLSC